MNLKDHFPRASQAFLDANPLSSPPEPIKTSSMGNVERIKGKRGGHSVSMSGEPYWSEGKSGRHGMNKTEAEFASILQMDKNNGKVIRYEFEGITLRWADMKYTPDFIAFDTTSSAWLSKDFPDIKIIRGIRLIEVKGGHIWDRDIVRFKGARAYWPEFQFEMWQKKKGQWTQLF